MTRFPLLITALIALLLLTTAAYAGPAQTQVDAPFPDLVLPTIDGQDAVRLSDHRGKKVLLIEFASW